MVVPSTVKVFRAMVSALRSLDGGEVVSFHTFTNLEDRCVRLLAKNLGRDMPDSFNREKLVSLDIHAQGAIELCSGDQDPAKDCPLTPTSLYWWRWNLRCSKCVQLPNSANCECQWRRTWLQRALCNARAASALDTRSIIVDMRPGAASSVGAPTPPVCGKASTRACQKERRHKPPHRYKSSVGRALCRADGLWLGVESRHLRGARCQGHHHTTVQYQSKTHCSTSHGSAQAA